MGGPDDLASQTGGKGMNWDVNGEEQSLVIFEAIRRHMTSPQRPKQKIKLQHYK